MNAIAFTDLIGAIFVIIWLQIVRKSWQLQLLFLSCFYFLILIDYHFGHGHVLLELLTARGIIIVVLVFILKVCYLVRVDELYIDWTI